MFEYKSIEESQSEERNTGGWRRAWAKILGPVAAVAALTGCMQEVTSPAPSAIETQAPSPDGSPSPTENVEIEAIRKDLEDSPVIDGLVYKIEENEDGSLSGIYYYAADNPYGGVEGKKAGERLLTSQVKTETLGSDGQSIEPLREIGGVVLSKEVIRRMFEINDGYRGNPICVIPFDASSLNSDESVMVVYNRADGFVNSLGSIDVKFEGSLPLMCISFGRDEIVTDYVVRRGYSIDPEAILLCDSFALENEYAYGNDGAFYYESMIRLFGFLGDFDLDYSFDEISRKASVGNFNYGDKICNVEGDLRIVNAGGQVLEYPLLVGGELVFILAD
ncbi:MAG: hypothetical protein WDA65_05235 [Christensenellales bacterium]